ncbi:MULTISPECIES: nucleoside 2-deoxyribosyltransferase [unclassified Bradyrhizobium]
MISNRPNVYLAGPLFSPQERQWNVLLRDSLMGFADVYLPQEDGALLVDLIASGMSVQEAKSSIFATDIRAIDRCDILLLVMDGRVIDEGACFELGYAYSRGKLCLGLKTDVRALLPVGDNPMIDCALRKIFRDVDSACDWIRQRRWEQQ